MSAIFGIVNLDGRPVAHSELTRMAETLAHLAPDGFKFWREGAVGLGHGLLRTNTEDEFDHQPLEGAASSVVVVADLRLDNREQLATALGVDAAALAEMPDSGLLIRAYERWGGDCASRLLGDFAFAIWDAPARKLVLGRDHLGQRCVFFHHGEGQFVFSSEIKGLWALPATPRAISDDAIARLLVIDRSVEPGRTRFEGIGVLPSATVISITEAGQRTQRAYWRPQADPAHLGHDEAYYVAAYRRVLGEAVACRLRRARAPAGLLLSGGYDSTAVAALAGETLNAQGRKLICAASVMPADYSGTIRHARKWVAMCARDMKHLDVRYVEREGMNPFENMEDGFRACDGPVTPYIAVQHALYGAIAGAGAQVVLDGYGGDQTINPRGLASLARLLAAGRLRTFFREFAADQRMTGSRWIDIAKRDVLFLLAPEWLLAAYKRLRGRRPAIWGGGSINPSFAASIAVERTLVPVGQRRVNRDMRADMIKALEQRMAKVGPGVAAQHGLESTRPFYDKRVVELALAIPLDLYVKNGRTRYLACRALADLYPPEYQTRWRKNDDQIPDFQALVKSHEPELLAQLDRMERSGAMGRYIDFDKIRRLLAARGVDDHSSGWEHETQAAVNGFAVARFVEWFRGYN